MPSWTDVACTRCGRKRQVKNDRAINDECHDCKHLPVIEPEPLTGGEFVRRGLVWRFEIYTCPCGEPIDSPLGTCDRGVAWAERDSVRASWRRPIEQRQEAA